MCVPPQTPQRLVWLQARGVFGVINLHSWTIRMELERRAWLLKGTGWNQQCDWFLLLRTAAESSCRTMKGTQPSVYSKADTGSILLFYKDISYKLLGRKSPDGDSAKQGKGYFHIAQGWQCETWYVQIDFLHCSVSPNRKVSKKLGKYSYYFFLPRVWLKDWNNFHIRWSRAIKSIINICLIS